MSSSFQPLTLCAFYPFSSPFLQPPLSVPPLSLDHLIPVFTLTALFTLFPPTLLAVSTMSYLPFLPSHHIACLVMGFDKAVLNQLLAAPAAEPKYLFSSHAHAPFLLYPCKGQLLKMWVLCLPHSMFMCVHLFVPEWLFTSWSLECWPISYL